jgi:hypothetical protein
MIVEAFVPINDVESRLGPGLVSELIDAFDQRPRSGINGTLMGHVWCDLLTYPQAVDSRLSNEVRGRLRYSEMPDAVTTDGGIFSGEVSRRCLAEESRLRDLYLTD